MKLAGQVLLALIAFAAPLCAQKPSDAKCSTCGGAGEVSCPCCLAKGTIEVPCPWCAERGPAPCTNCGGSGTIVCTECEGKGSVVYPGSAAGFTHREACHKCGGAGKVPCRVCVKGNMPCFWCKGTGKHTRVCPLCQGRHKLKCPDCSGCARADKCPICAGQKTETCPICAGRGKFASACAACKGSGIEGCANCKGFGGVPCDQCNGTGFQYTAPNPLGIASKFVCPTCKGRRYKPCPNCSGKGSQPCAKCGGRGAERDCWCCGGKGKIPCRRCGTGKAWSATDPVSGVRVTVFPLDAFEPQVLAAVRDAFPDAHGTLLRVVLDASSAKSELMLGGPNGWTLYAVEEGGRQVPTGAAPFTKGQETRYRGLLAYCGVAAEGTRFPLAASKSHLATTLVWKEGDAGGTPREIRLRRGTGMDTDEVPLQAGDATGDDWLRLVLGTERK